MSKTFHIDINTTKSCNLRCTYCFEVKDEMDKKFVFKETDAFLGFLNNFLETDFFKEKYEDVSINFWGGEPTLNLTLYKKLINEYLEDGRVRFFVYSNGYHFTDYFMNSFKALQRLKVNGHPKIVVQVSYDGNPIHDKTRITPTGAGSAEKVKETIQQLIDNDIFHVLKSTVDASNFKHMFEAYKDLLTVSDGYFPTLDIHAEYESDEYKVYGDELYEQLVKIAAYDKEHNLSGFRWFQNSQALCSAGVHMIAIDLNGNVLPCHGALYTDYDEHLITNIKEIDAVDRVIESTKRFEKFWFKKPSDCKNCRNAFCLKCNVAKFQSSKKETYEEKWTDHTSQSYYCYFMDIVGIVSKARRDM